MLTEDDVISYALSFEGACVRYPYGTTPLVLSTADVHEFGELYEGTSPLHIVLKCEPDEAVSLRKKYTSVKPGYRCCKKYWNSVFIDGSIPDSEIKRMIRNSYDIAMKIKTKKKKEIQPEADIVSAPADKQEF